MFEIMMGKKIQPHQREGEDPEATPSLFLSLTSTATHCPVSPHPDGPAAEAGPG